MMHTCSYCEQPSRHDIHCVWETRWHGVVLCLRLHRFFYVRHAPPGRTQRVRWPTTKQGKSTCRPPGCMCVSFTMHRAVGGGRLAPSLCHPTRPRAPFKCHPTSPSLLVLGGGGHDAMQPRSPHPARSTEISRGARPPHLPCGPQRCSPRIPPMKQAPSQAVGSELCGRLSRGRL